MGGDARADGYARNTPADVNTDAVVYTLALLYGYGNRFTNGYDNANRDCYDDSDRYSYQYIYT